MGRSSVGGAGHILYRMIPMHRGDSNAIVRGNLLSQARTTCKQPCHSVLASQVRAAFRILGFSRSSVPLVRPSPQPSPLRRSK